MTSERPSPRTEKGPWLTVFTLYWAVASFGCFWAAFDSYRGWSRLQALPAPWGGTPAHLQLSRCLGFVALASLPLTGLYLLLKRSPKATGYWPPALVAYAAWRVLLGIVTLLQQQSGVTLGAIPTASPIRLLLPYFTAAVVALLWRVYWLRTHPTDHLGTAVHAT